MDNVDKEHEVAENKGFNSIVSVDKSVEKYKNANIVKGEQKILTIDVDEEWIENNLIDMPFIYYYQSKEPINMVEYKWKSNDGLNRSIQVRSSIYGVPSPFEFDVLLALLRIHFKNNNNVVYPAKNMNNTIHFTFRELAKEMGYKGFGGKTKEKLDKAIERLCDTNLYNTTQGGLYNPITKEYITDSKMVINILSDYKSYSYINTNEGVKLDKKSLKDKASVVIHEFFFTSICNGKGKISDKNLRLSLKNSLSRRLYLILNKWRNNRSEMFLTYEKMYERIPLIDSKTISYRNKRIKSASEELVEKGFLKSINVQNRGITFVFNDKKIKSSPEPTPTLLKKYNNYDELINGLKFYGLNDNEIKEYLTLDKILDAQAMLRYIDIHTATIKNPKAYIIYGFKNGYNELMKNSLYCLQKGM